MKKIIVIIWLFFSLAVSGQSSINLCESGIRTANERLAKGRIYFPRYIFDSSITLRKILEQDYGIVDQLYSEYCVSFERELRCHDSLMMKAIADKWGHDFYHAFVGVARKRVRRSPTKGMMTHNNLKTHFKLMHCACW